MPHQLRNILSALPQSWNIDRKYFQPIIKILAKCRLLHHRSQITMRGGDQADVNLVRTVAAESLEFLLLQDSQQFRLKFQRNVADFVKKERAFVARVQSVPFSARSLR